MQPRVVGVAGARAPNRPKTAQKNLEAKRRTRIDISSKLFRGLPKPNPIQFASEILQILPGSIPRFRLGLSELSP
jgi:hypothetical protein